VFAWGGSSLREAQPVVLIALLTLVVSGPHYGGTLLRVYERRADRQAYALFTVWATLAVALLFVVAVHQPRVGAWMFTLYISWSPWHYTGQNYGLALMLLGRRGVDLSPPARRLLHLSFVCSFLVPLMVLHGSSQASGYVPNPTDYGQPRVAFVSLGLPYGFARSVLVIASLVHVGALVAALSVLLRRSSLRQLAPACAIIGLQILWFSIPFSLIYWGIETGIDPLDRGITSYYVVWTAMGHALQYLWVTTYYARASSAWTGYPRYLAKVLASGAAIWTLPGLVFAGAHLGTLDSVDGLLLLTASGVNLHHFILDGAIWKLRNSRVASVLIRSVPESSTDGDALAGGWLRRGVWSLCALATGIAVATLLIEHGLFARALREGDPARARAALDWIARAGHEKPEHRRAVADAFRRSGDLEAAIPEYVHSLALRPTTPALRGLSEIHLERRDWQRVIDVWQSVPSDAPLDPALAGSATQAYYALGQRDQARRLLDAVLARTEGRAGDYSRFGDAARAQADQATAARYYRKALELEPERQAAANNLAWILATSSDPALRDPSEALRLAEGVVARAATPDPNHLDTLAAAQTAAGRHAEAVATIERALALARELGEEALAVELEAHLRIYRRRAAEADAS
jgi:tetratricopeptide (TPR) repeat protein